MNKYEEHKNFFRADQGFSLPELFVVLLIIAIIAVIALPQIISSSRLFNFAGTQRQITSSLRDARQDAISERKPITFEYDSPNNKLLIYGGKYGIKGVDTNKIFLISSGASDSGAIIYGRPIGVSAVPLDDGSDLTNLTSGTVTITFQGDGSVRDGSENLFDKAIYSYYGSFGMDAVFAGSIRDSSVGIEAWTYRVTDGKYVEKQIT